MFSKGDKVSVLDEAMNGVVLSVKDNQVTIETEDGFVMTFFVNELIKVHVTSNLMDSIKRINVSEISKEKEIKGWKKDKKITLIKTINPDLNFLNDLFE